MGGASGFGVKPVTFLQLLGESGDGNTDTGRQLLAVKSSQTGSLYSPRLFLYHTAYRTVI